MQLRKLVDFIFPQHSGGKLSDLYDKAIRKGGLRREDTIRLHHGIALQQSGKQAQAKTAFAWASFDETAQMIGRVWLLVTAKP